MAQTQREKVREAIKRMGKAAQSAPGNMRQKGGFAPLEFADAIYRGYNKEEEQKNIPTPIEIRPKNFDVRTVPAQPLMGPNDKVASSIDPNTGRTFPPGQELDADNIAISQLRSSAKEPGAGAANENTASLLNGLKYGGDLAQSQKHEGLINEASDMISGLLGNVDFKGLFRVLARPEFTAPMGPGQTPVTNFIQAAAADRTAQATSAAAQQTAGLEGFKAETDRLKALMPDSSKMPKLTSEVSKIYDSMAAAENTARLGKQIQESLVTSNFITGAPGAAAQGFRAIAALFGADPGTMEADEVKRKIADLKKQVLQSRAFGREANKQELEILNKLVQSPELFASKEQILNSVQGLMDAAERSRFALGARLEAFNLPQFRQTRSLGYSINPRPRQ